MSFCIYIPLQLGEAILALRRGLSEVAPWFKRGGRHNIGFLDIYQWFVTTTFTLQRWLQLKSSRYTSRYAEFCKLLRKARLEAGLSQVEVSKRLKKPQSFVSYIERAQRRVDFIELLELAELYRKPLSFFMPR